MSVKPRWPRFRRRLVVGRSTLWSPVATGSVATGSVAMGVAAMGLLAIGSLAM
jgi:hypothetical protein